MDRKKHGKPTVATNTKPHTNTTANRRHLNLDFDEQTRRILGPEKHNLLNFLDENRQMLLEVESRLSQLRSRKQQMNSLCRILMKFEQHHATGGSSFRNSSCTYDAVGGGSMWCSASCAAERGSGGDRSQTKNGCFTPAHFAVGPSSVSFAAASSFREENTASTVPALSSSGYSCSSIRWPHEENVKDGIKTEEKYTATGKKKEHGATKNPAWQREETLLTLLPTGDMFDRNPPANTSTDWLSTHGNCQLDQVNGREATFSENEELEKADEVRKSRMGTSESAVSSLSQLVAFESLVLPFSATPNGKGSIWGCRPAFQNEGRIVWSQRWEKLLVECLEDAFQRYCKALRAMGVDVAVPSKGTVDSFISQTGFSNAHLQPPLFTTERTNRRVDDLSANLGESAHETQRHLQLWKRMLRDRNVWIGVAAVINEAMKDSVSAHPVISNDVSGCIGYSVDEEIDVPSVNAGVSSGAGGLKKATALDCCLHFFNEMQRNRRPFRPEEDAKLETIVSMKQKALQISLKEKTAQTKNNTSGPSPTTCPLSGIVPNGDDVQEHHVTFDFENDNNNKRIGMDWEEIAEELGTNRSAFMCFQRHIRMHSFQRSRAGPSFIDTSTQQHRLKDVATHLILQAESPEKISDLEICVALNDILLDQWCAEHKDKIGNKCSVMNSVHLQAATAVKSPIDTPNNVHPIPYVSYSAVREMCFRIRKKLAERKAMANFVVPSDALTVCYVALALGGRCVCHNTTEGIQQTTVARSSIPTGIVHFLDSGYTSASLNNIMQQLEECVTATMKTVFGKEVASSHVEKVVRSLREWGQSNRVKKENEKGEDRRPTKKRMTEVTPFFITPSDIWKVASLASSSQIERESQEINRFSHRHPFLRAVAPWKLKQENPEESGDNSRSPQELIEMPPPVSPDDEQRLLWSSRIEAELCSTHLFVNFPEVPLVPGTNHRDKLPVFQPTNLSLRFFEDLPFSFLSSTSPYSSIPTPTPSSIEASPTTSSTATTDSTSAALHPGTIDSGSLPLVPDVEAVSFQRLREEEIEEVRETTLDSKKRKKRSRSEVENRDSKETIAFQPSAQLRTASLGVLPVLSRVSGAQKAFSRLTQVLFSLPSSSSSSTVAAAAAGSCFDMRHADITPTCKSGRTDLQTSIPPNEVRPSGDGGNTSIEGEARKRRRREVYNECQLYREASSDSPQSIAVMRSEGGSFVGSQAAAAAMKNDEGEDLRCFLPSWHAVVAAMLFSEQKGEKRGKKR